MASLPVFSLPQFLPEWFGLLYRGFDMPKANLGLASTEKLFRELICRLAIVPVQTSITHLKATERGLILAEMLGGLDSMEREYRTVDSS